MQMRMWMWDEGGGMQMWRRMRMQDEGWMLMQMQMQMRMRMRMRDAPVPAAPITRVPSLQGGLPRSPRRGTISTGSHRLPRARCTQRLLVPCKNLHRKVVSSVPLPFVTFLLFLGQGDSPEAKSP